MELHLCCSTEVLVVTKGAHCPNAVQQKAMVQSLKEGILEALMVFSAGCRGIVTQQRGGVRLFKILYKRYIF